MRIRVLYDCFWNGSTYKRGTIIKVERDEALYLIQEGLACFPTENPVKLPREMRDISGLA